MGACVSKKHKDHISIKNLSNPEAAANYDLEGSQYSIQDFNPSIKSPFKREEVDITLKASLLFEKPISPKYKQPIQSPKGKFEIAKIVSPEIILDRSENKKIESGNQNLRTGNRKIEFKFFNDVPETLKAFSSKLVVDEQVVSEVVVYEKGLVLLPKGLIKSESGVYECEFSGKRYTLELFLAIGEVFLFKLPNFSEAVNNLNSFAPCKDVMSVEIAGETCTLTKVLDKKNCYSVSKEIQKPWLGITVYFEGKPCFVIQNLLESMMIKIRTLSQICKVMENPLAGPTLPVASLSMGVYNGAHEKLFAGFQYKNNIFSFFRPSLKVPDKVFTSIHGRYFELRLILKSYFIIYEAQEYSSQGLELYETNPIEKIAFLYSNNQPIPFNQSTKNPEVYKTTSKIVLTAEFIGQPLYNANQEPFSLIISIQSEHSLRALPLSKLEEFFASVKPNFFYHPKQDFEPSSSSFSDQDLSLSSDFIEVFHPSHKQQEADLEEKGMGEFVLDFNPDAVVADPEETSYILIGSTLLKYSNRHFAPETLQLPISYSEDASYVSTTSGLVIVKGKTASLVQGSELKNLSPLNEPHHFHAAVVHHTQLFVISGKGTATVEYLDLLNVHSDWKKLQSLPEIREQAAACSAGSSVYVLGGSCGSMVTGTVYKYSQRWETLNWTVPSYFGMGAFCSDNTIVVFGGKGASAYNDFYYCFSVAGKALGSEEFPITGLYSNKSIGQTGSAYSIILSETQSLEFSDSKFKLVSTISLAN